MQLLRPLLPFLTALLAVAFWHAAVPAHAQSTRATVAERVAAAVKPQADRLEAIQQLLEDENIREQRLNHLRDELEQLDNAIVGSLIQLQPAISEVNTGLDRLPPLPADGEPPEPEEIAAERKRLSDLKAKTVLALRDAEQTTVRARALVTRVLELRRDRFVGRLLQRNRLDGSNFNALRESLPREAHTVYTVLRNWVTATLPANPGKLLAVFLISAAFVFLLHILLRPLRRWVMRQAAEEHTSYLHRITLAFFTIVIPAAAFAVLLFSIHQLLQYFGLYRLRVDHIMATTLTVLWGWLFVWLLIRATLAPRDGNRRLLDISGSAARRLSWLLMAIAIIYGLDYLIGRIVVIFSQPVEFTVVKSLVATVAIGFALVGVVTTRLRPPFDEGHRSGYRGWHPVAYWLVWATIMAIVIASVSGYVSLARFIAGQMVITGSILATMYIGFLASRAVAAPGAMATTTLGHRMRAVRDYSDLRLDQFGLVISIFINVLVLLVGVPILLLQWGFQIGDLTRIASSAILGFSIGGVEISLGRLLFAVLVFAALIAATRFVQRWFDGKVLARTQLDSGVKNSIKSGVGYIGFFLAAIVGISWAGFNLSNLALIAGALSVGIGFGLQNIVNNFVSGIIMLIERPIKVGDIIAVAGSEGFVRKINVRATELETFDRQSVIIPNSEVINTSVGNWMHTDSVRRILIRVGVAYGSDIEKVREVLLSTVAGDQRVASHPPPFVYFADFGASSLDFELRFFLRDIMETPLVETDVRFKIDAAFRETGIEIPFPQTDLHIRSGLPEAAK